MLHQILRRPPALLAEEGSGENRLVFLGTAGFILKTPDRTLVLDPYLSRAGLIETALFRLKVDEALGAKVVPEADEVLVGHAHHDHILDAPAICLRTGARLVGSRAVCHVGRAAGVPEAQLVEVQPHQPISCGSCVVKAIPSLHGKAIFGRVPLPGDILKPPPWPPRFTELRHGQVHLWQLELGTTRILHVDSADYLDSELVGYKADILLLCAVGRQYRARYTRDLIEKTGARIVVPCHWDDFTVPLGSAPRQLPGVDLDGFVREIEDCGAQVRLLGTLQGWRF
jgi:L-ascorbate metabolism protein UlaG (beta-lactamase superfamily)